MKLKLHVEAPLHLIERQVLGDRLHSNMMHIQVFHDGVLSGTIIDLNHMRKLIYHLVTVLKDEFMSFFFFLTFSDI